MGEWVRGGVGACVRASEKSRCNRVHTRIGMRVGMCVDMCIDACVDACGQTCVQTYWLIELKFELVHTDASGRILSCIEHSIERSIERSIECSIEPASKALLVVACVWMC